MQLKMNQKYDQRQLHLDLEEKVRVITKYLLSGCYQVNPYDSTIVMLNLGNDF